MTQTGAAKTGTTPVKKQTNKKAAYSQRLAGLFHTTDKKPESRQQWLSFPIFKYMISFTTLNSIHALLSSTQKN